MAEDERKLVGKVVNYFTKIGVAIIELNDSLAVGDRISVEGATTNQQQTVESVQIEHKAIEKARKGDRYRVEKKLSTAAGRATASIKLAEIIFLLASYVFLNSFLKVVYDKLGFSIDNAYVS